MLPPSTLEDKPVLDGVLHQRLKQHGRNHHFEGLWIQLLDDSQLVAAEAHHFDIEIVVDEFHFLAQRNKGIAAVEQAPKRCWPA